MEILVVASTLPELQSVTAACQVEFLSEGLYKYILPKSGRTFHVLIAGVGATATVFQLTRLLLEHRPKLAIQAGIAGAYDTGLRIGQAVIVQQDRFGSLGAEEEDRLLDVFDLGFADPDAAPFRNGQLQCPISDLGPLQVLQKVSSITVETTTGTEATRTLRFKKYHPHIETMEGAAFYYVCAQLGIPAVQIRTISNYVEKRNKLNWNIPLAVSALQQPLLDYLENLTD